MIIPGDWFKITHRKHFAFGEVHCCTGMPHIKVRGYDDVLDLGNLVRFTVRDYYDKPAHHVVPQEWCQPCERPNISKRVK